MFPTSGKGKDVPTPRICDVVWHDGEFIKWTDARVHVMSHVLHYGSSVFEGIRCYDTKRGPAIFRLKEHMQRFLNSAKIYRMEQNFATQIVNLQVGANAFVEYLPDPIMPFRNARPRSTISSGAIRAIRSSSTNGCRCRPPFLKARRSSESAR